MSLLLLLAYGLVLGLNNVTELTVTFIAALAGIIAVNKIKDPINLIVFGLVSMVLHLSTVGNQMQSFLSLYKVDHAAHIDALIGLESELSYVEMVADINNHIINTQEKFALIMCNLNGLKAIDDTYVYGCEGVVEAGHFLKYVFKTSRAFHVGGDEYIVQL